MNGTGFSPNIGNVLQDILSEFSGRLSETNDSATPRDYVFPAIPKKIMVAIGMRRSGKTYFLLQTIRKLLQKNIPLQSILYLNFEDDRLYPLTQNKLSNLIDSFYTLYPDNHDRQCYLFFDEIQNVENWSQVVRRYFDTKKVQIYLTGSSAKLLSKEIATSLRGRSISLEIWPYSFIEFLRAKQGPSALLSLQQQPVVGKKILDNLSALFGAYITEGGFPETTSLSEVDRIRVLQDYVNVVIFRDIIERHNITNTILIKYIIRALLKNTGTLFSVNKFYNDLKTQGFSVGKNTVHDYLGYIEDAYLAFMVPLYSESVKKTQTNPKKIYAVDPGLVNAYTTSSSQNLGHLFENIVYLDLRRQQHEIYYYLTQDRYEVDFLTKDISGKLHLYQVTWNCENKQTLEREMRALHAAEKELGIKGELITPEHYLRRIAG